MKLLAPTALCAGIAIGLAGAAHAELQWRVSVKFILDSNGERTDGNVSTDADVNAQIDVANVILAGAGRGYLLELVEIEEVSGQSSFFTSCDRAALEGAAENNSTFKWRSDAINIYVTDGDCPGFCSFPNTGADMILVGRTPRTTTFLHEIGHFMNLCHTQGCPCGSCDSGGGVCNDTPGDDNITDTLPDLSCWDQDDIAQWSFGQDYTDLTSAQKDDVDGVFFNIMSYHNTRDRYTPLQLDVTTDTSNGPRNHVATGISVFVDTDYFGVSLGSSSNPWITIQAGYNATSSGDNIAIRGGTYNETPTLTQRRLLLATDGPVVIR